uniref:Uncharacterized protein n=1 Tax=Oryza rufipogon TaxID=4529 RepID=A0A0E0PK49_ORYRU
MEFRRRCEAHSE